MKALLVLLALTTVARADDVPPAPFAAPPPGEVGELQSESTALWLSLGGTAASIGLLAGGAALGEKVPAFRFASVIGGLTLPFAPCFGHWYSGSYATRGLALRGAGAFVGLVAFGLAISAGGTTVDEDRRRTTIIGALSIAGGLWVAGTVDDIIQAPRRVHRRNQTLIPYVAPTGVGVAGRF